MKITYAPIPWFNLYLCIQDFPDQDFPQKVPIFMLWVELREETKLKTDRKVTWTRDDATFNKTKIFKIFYKTRNLVWNQSFGKKWFYSLTLPAWGIIQRYEYMCRRGNGLTTKRVIGLNISYGGENTTLSKTINGSVCEKWKKVTLNRRTFI